MASRHYVYYAGQPRPADNGNGKGGPSLLVLALLVISLALYTQRDDATGSARRSVQAVQPTSTVETVWGPDTWQSPQVVEQAYIAWRPEADGYFAWRPEDERQPPQNLMAAGITPPSGAREPKWISLAERPDNIELLAPDAFLSKWSCETTGGQPNLWLENRGQVCIPREVLAAAAWVEKMGGVSVGMTIALAQTESNNNPSANCSSAGGRPDCGLLQMSSAHYTSHACWPGGSPSNILDAICSMSNWASKYGVDTTAAKQTFVNGFVGKGTWTWNQNRWQAAVVWEGGRAIDALRYDIWQQLAKTQVQAATSPPTDCFWRRPVTDAVLAQAFGYTQFSQKHCSYGRDAQDQCKPHPGVDLAIKTGTPIYSSWSCGGKVTFAGSYGGYGNMVKVDHDNGYESLYGHMSKVLVSKGDQVDGSTVLGLVGSTGKSDGPHVHWEVYKDGQLVDPLKLTGD